MKQFPYDSTTDVVLPALKSLVRSNPNLTLLEREKVVVRSADTYNERKVTLISGGGSGHEPTHAGLVGPGLLDAAVCGQVFASPSTKQVLAGIEALVPSSLGTLVVVKNYTGDVINFGLAAERAQSNGRKVRVVVVQDDVAVGRKKGGLVGRRGLAGTVLVHKIAGAAAQRSGKEPEKYTLDAVANVAQSVADNLVTVAASLEHCNVPGRAFSTSLGAQEMEIGMGIHNEPGAKKLESIPTVKELITKELLPLLLNPKDEDRAFVPFENSNKIVLLVNNLGGLSNLETHYIANAAVSALKSQYKITPARVLVGTFITALNGPGFSLTLLNASRASLELHAHVPSLVGISITDLLDELAIAPGWSVLPLLSDSAKYAADGTESNVQPQASLPEREAASVVVKTQNAAAIIKAGLKSVVKVEPQVTKYDTVAGDGDCGETLVNGAIGIMRGLGEDSAKDLATVGIVKDEAEEDPIPVDKIRLDNAVETITDIASIVEDYMGGTSGGLYAIYLHALARGLAKAATSATDMSIPLLVKATKDALSALQKYTRAAPGDRTLMDALVPFVKTLAETESLEKAVAAAQEGADSTRKLEAKFGRASYVAKEELAQFDKEGGLPDPGAFGLAALLQGLLSGYKNSI
ncbi:uncharacterized protein SAPINGB_P002914 [Magnusiomyces paraingens]|uniref:Dihydroxyacetone kinase n=1 Tax=Magnusiomyces paraingens TaxID=2606893 RepID=A0A5E8BH56_9ASCO|nr:uncharacterized protein SAPINGB_P002914 [Saprochaete ingens]VVT50890.1 unnamed protein product [Saprochaete ingens]